MKQRFLRNAMVIVTSAVMCVSGVGQTIFAEDYEIGEIQFPSYVDYNDDIRFIEAEVTGDWTGLEVEMPEVVGIPADTDSETDINILSIIGSDNRTKVNNYTQFPYRACVLIRVNYRNAPLDPRTGKPKKFGGSGAIISADTVITAAHVLDDNLYGGIDSIEILAGYPGGDITYAKSTAGKKHIYPQYSSGNTDQDLALLRLNRPIGLLTNTFSFATSGGVGTGITLAGYPEDKANELYKSTGTITHAQTNMLFYNADAEHGQSGSPVYNSSNQIIAIHKGSTEIEGSIVNGGPQITSTTMNWINGIVTNRVVVFCVYNPNSGEHYYTANSAEALQLESFGWICEKIAWGSPTNGTPVYQLYNSNTGEHFYTTNAGERNLLVSFGWTYEKIAFYSDNNHTIPVYRLYNPNAEAHNHHFTTSVAERNYLVNLGWNSEGVAFYCIE